MDEGNEIATIVREELANVENTLRTHVSDAVAARFVETTGALGEIRTQLNALQAAAAAPNDQPVKDLEARLIESEKAIREFTLRTQSLQLSDSQRAAASDEALFRGSFMRDTKEIAQRLQALRHSGGDARAIDTSLFVTGGKLSATTADRFIDYLIEKQVSLSRVTTRRMMAPQGNTDVLAVSRRKIRKAVEGIEPDTAEGFATKRRTMTTVEVIWAEDLTLTFLEDNIEKAGAEAHIARMLATQFGNDLNDLAWNGNEDQDSSGDDGFISINDGWLKLALDDSQVTDLNATTGLTSPSNTDILAAAFRSMSVDYKSMASLLYFAPVPFCERYAEEVATRETALGDAVLINGLPALRYFGHPVLPESHLMETSAGYLMLTPPENLYHGIQRQLMIDSEWKPRKRAIEITLTARNDFEYSTGLAIVLVNTIPSANR